MATNPKIQKIINVAVASASGAGVTVALIASDGPILAGIWGTMIYKIAKEHDVDFDTETCVKIATAVIAGSAAWMAGCKILTKILTWTMVAIPVALGINAVINAFYTWRLGVGFDKIFSQSGYEKTITKLASIAITFLAPIPKLSEVSDFFDDVVLS